MPILSVKLSGSPSATRTDEISAALIGLTAKILGKKPDVTAVAIDYLDPRHWIIGGKSLADHGKSGFFLDVKVTDGTNTKDEKARYIADVFAAVGGILGDLHPVSYICVTDIRADAWGFAGLTQEYRYIKSKA